MASEEGPPKELEDTYNSQDVFDGTFEDLPEALKRMGEEHLNDTSRCRLDQTIRCAERRRVKDHLTDCRANQGNCTAQDSKSGRAAIWLRAWPTP